MWLFFDFYICESVGRFILDKWVPWDTRFQMWMSIRRFRLNLRVRWDFQIWLESLWGAQVCFSDSEGFSISNPNIRRTFSFKFDSPVSLWNAKGRWVRLTHLNFKDLRTFYFKYVGPSDVLCWICESGAVQFYKVHWMQSSRALFVLCKNFI